MEDAKIRFSDIIEPDDSIEKLIRQLSEAGNTFTTMANSIKDGASKIKTALDSVSGATSSGRAAISESEIAADRLARAQRELRIALTATGKEIAWLKEQTKEVNKDSVIAKQYAEALNGSYDKLNAMLKESVRLWKSLSDAERNDAAVGGALLDDIISLKRELNALNGAMKPVVETTNKVEQAKRRLADAQSKEGKEIASVNAQIAEQNRQNTLEAVALNNKMGSYVDMKARLALLDAEYKKLSESERNNIAIGGSIIAQMAVLREGIAAVDAEIKGRTASLNEATSIEEKINSAYTREGMSLLELQERYKAIMAARREEAKIQAELDTIQERINNARSEENTQLQSKKRELSEATRLAKLEAQAANSAEGSYNRLSAQYEINKIRLNAMSRAERESTQAGKELEEETRSLYARMKQLQEATGNYRLNVGNYRSAFDGLQFSMNQIVREMPSLAISMNTFFLAISNNIPMLVDEINKVRAANKLAAEEGRAQTSVWKGLAKSVFSWQTLLIAVLTLLVQYGDEIIDFTSKLLGFNKAVMTSGEILSKVSEELKSTNASYGENVVRLRELSDEYKKLNSVMAKKKFVAEYREEVEQMGIALRGVQDAESLFVNNTDKVIDAFKLRARAAAARNLAVKSYEEALQKQAEIESEEQSDPAWYDYAGQVLVPGTNLVDLFFKHKIGALAESVQAQRIKVLKDEYDEALKSAEAFYEKAEDYETLFGAGLQGAGLTTAKKSKGGRGGGGAQPQDLTETILKNALKVRRDYNKSVLKLTEDEYEHRKQEARYQIEDENNRLRDMLRLNEKYVANVGGKYKKLTDEQKKEIELQNDYLTKTINNNAKYLERTLEKIANEQGINAEKIFRTTQRTVEGLSVSVDTDAIESSLQKEKRLAIANVELEYQLRINALKNLSKEEQKYARSEEELTAEKNNAILGIEAEYNAKIYGARVEALDLRLAAVRENSKEELDLRVKQLEAQRDLELAENLKKPVEEQQNSVDITKKYEKQIADVKYKYAEKAFLLNQELAESEFGLRKRTDREEYLFKKQQEIDYWKWRLDNDENMSEQERQILRNKIAKNEQDKKNKNWNAFLGGTASHGLSGGLLSMLGFDEEALSAFDNAKNEILSGLQEIFDAEVEHAEAQVELYEKKVDAAQNAYDAEIEARNNGYANNVATTKSELQLEKQRLAQKQKMLEKAKKQQEAFNTAQQVSSLITATAQIWQAFSGFGPLGVALAIATIGTMFASFAASKIKARQVAKAESEEYGEGGLEFLEGGSHASGNDIDLGVNNKKKKRMRAEGGEALAIINKKQTRKYRKALPDIVNSLNRGIFEDKYANAFKSASDVASNIIFNESNTDITALEREVREIRKSLNTRVYSSDGFTIVQKGNVKRIIKN